MPPKSDQTQMNQEAREGPVRVRKQLEDNIETLTDLVQHLQIHPPRLVVTCARGSSAHAAQYAKFLIESHIGILTMPMALSLNSIYESSPNMQDVLVIAISQSGQSPDLISTLKSAKTNGAYIVAFINNTDSPLAKYADIIVPIRAGAEMSVAATKSFLCSVSTIAQFISLWSQDRAFTNALKSLPKTMQAALSLDWSAGLKALISAQSLFIISRSSGLSIAKEAALKCKETCGIHAEAFSAAEIKHGPMTLITSGTPVLVFSTHDQSQVSIDNITTSFIKRGAVIISIGNEYAGAINLKSIRSQCPSLNGITQIQTFYILVNSLSLARGYDPDHPAYLQKATKTL